MGHRKGKERRSEKMKRIEKINILKKEMGKRSNHRERLVPENWKNIRFGNMESLEKEGALGWGESYRTSAK